MKLSKETLEILQNFATINQSILFLEGKTQKTFTTTKTCYAEATVAEEFPQEFAIYDLNMFLGLISLFKDPEIELTDTSVVIQDGRQKATYRFCSPSLITHPPKDKKIQLGKVKSTFELTSEDFKSLLKAVALYSQEFIGIEADGDGLYVKTLNVKEKDSDGVSLRIADTDQTFRYVISVDNMKMLPHSYDVSVLENMGVVFKSKTTDLMYVVPSEASHSNKG